MPLALPLSHRRPRRHLCGVCRRSLRSSSAELSSACTRTAPTRLWSTDTSSQVVVREDLTSGKVLDEITRSTNIAASW